MMSGNFILLTSEEDASGMRAGRLRGITERWRRQNVLESRGGGRLCIFSG